MSEDERKSAVQKIFFSPILPVRRLPDLPAHEAPTMNSTLDIRRFLLSL